MTVRDDDFNEFRERWTTEYAEWLTIQTELVEARGIVTAHDVSLEHEKRMRERGEISVIEGPIAKKLGLNFRPVLRSVPKTPTVNLSNVRQFLAGYSRAEVREIRDCCDSLLGAGNCWRMGCREPVDEGKSECAFHPLDDEPDDREKTT